MRIGHLTATLPDNRDQQRLVSDPRGTLVGWVGEDRNGELILVTHDQASGRSRSYASPGAPPEDDALFFAIDKRTGYWRTPAGVYAVDLDTGREHLIMGGPAHDFEIYSVEDGVLAFSPNADTTFFVGRSLVNARVLRDLSAHRGRAGRPIRLSRTGRWLSLGVAEIEGGLSEEGVPIVKITPEVYDTTTGNRFTLHVPGDPPAATPNVWLDDTTLQVLVGGVQGDPRVEPLELFTCTLPNGSCQLAAVIRPTEPTVSFALPDGRWYGLS